MRAPRPRKGHLEGAVLQAWPSLGVLRGEWEEGNIWNCEASRLPKLQIHWGWGAGEKGGDGRQRTQKIRLPLPRRRPKSQVWLYYETDFAALWLDILRVSILTGKMSKSKI